jgi:hypothetical protein
MVRKPDQAARSKATERMIKSVEMWSDQQTVLDAAVTILGLSIMTCHSPAVASSFSSPMVPTVGRDIASLVSGALLRAVC